METKVKITNQNDKKRKVNWQPPSQENSSHQPTITHKKTKKNKLQLDQYDLLVIAKIEAYFELNLVYVLITKLNDRNQDIVFLIMQTTNYRIFDLALDYNHVKLVQCIAEKLSEKQLFIMLNHENFAKFKAFVQFHLNKSTQFSNDKPEDFMLIINIILLHQESKWQTFELVYETIKQAKLDKKTLELLLRFIPLLDKEKLLAVNNHLDKNDDSKENQQNFQPIFKAAQKTSTNNENDQYSFEKLTTENNF